MPVSSEFSAPPHAVRGMRPWLLAIALSGALLACGGGGNPDVAGGTPPPAGGGTPPAAPNGGAASLSFSGPPAATPLALKRMAMGSSRVLALKNDGTLYSWGVEVDAPGVLGDGNPAAKQDLLLPTRATVLESEASRVVDVALSFKAAFALRSDGSLWAVGSNRYGELARAALDINAVDPAVRISGNYAKVATAAYTRVYALGVDQVLYWWGESLPPGPQALISGRVVDFWPAGTSIDPANPNAVLHWGYALLDDGTVVAWGDNTHGAFGNGTTVQQTGVVPVALPKIGVRDMASGVAVMADGTLYLWGNASPGAPRFYRDPDSGLRTPIGLFPTQVATGYASVGLTMDGRVVRLDVMADTDGTLVLSPVVESTTAARLFRAGVGLCHASGTCSPSNGLVPNVPAIVTTDGAVRIRPSGSERVVATGGVYERDAFDYLSSVFSAAFEAPVPPPSVPGTGPGAGDIDALAFPSTSHAFTCAGATDSRSAPVSNGPCLDSQKRFAKATGCNEFDSDFTFNSVGRPFFQCLVDNSTGSFKAYYQQSLTYYGG